MDELTKIEKNLSRLPREIINIILFYSHSYQPKCLLDDIKNISIVKRDLMTMYSHYWEYEDMEWLINDIISYANDYNATMFGYVDKFNNIFLRHMRLENVLQVENYIRSLERKNVLTQINVFLGLMTVEERNQLIKNTTEDFTTY